MEADPPKTSDDKKAPQENRCERPPSAACAANQRTARSAVSSQNSGLASSIDPKRRRIYGLLDCAKNRR
jgi:hypothetical protein